MSNNLEGKLRIMDIDEWLQNTLIEIAHHFPATGFFLLAANTELGHVEVSVASNIERPLLVDWLTQFTAEPQDRLHQSQPN
jgi:hypothetical protein